MGLLKNFYNKLHPPGETPVLSTPESQNEAEMALAKANTDLTAIVGQEDRVNDVVAKLKVQRERNHFGEMLEASMRPA